MKKNRYVILIVSLIIAFTGMITSCNDEDDSGSVNVVLDKDLVSLVIGTSETLVATVTPNTAAVTWNSGNAEVATVENGVVKAVGVGQTVINAKAGNSIAVCDIIVTVVPVPVVSISLQKTELLMAIGDKETIGYDFTPLEATSRKVTWSSNNNSVATVHPTTGEIEAISLGEAVITVTTLDGAKTDNCMVYVIPVLGLKEPGHNSTIALSLLDPDEKITFSWDTFADISEYVVKFSNTADFETPFFTAETTAGSVEISSYDLNEAIKERTANPIPIYWTVTPTDASVRVITRTNTLNLFPDRRDYIQLSVASATGMQITPQEQPYHYLLHTSGPSSILTNELAKALPDDSIVLCFNYKSNTTLSSMSVSLYKSDGTLQEGPIQAMALSSSNQWKEWAAPIDFTLFDWGAEGDYLKLDFGNEPAEIEINGIYFRGITYESEYTPQIFTITGFSGQTIVTRHTDTDFTIETTGTDPNVTLARLTRALPAGASILCFEYKSEQTMQSNLQIFFAPPLSEGNSVRLGTVPPADDWTTYKYDATDTRRNFIWGAKDDFLRLDFGEQPNYTIHIRNIRFEFK